jgi:hypothetical protein
MQEWYSERFRCLVQLTRHAIARMEERSITNDMVGELVESGKIRNKDKNRMWIYKDFNDRDDNLICVAAVMDDKLVIKTVMHRWQLEEETV